MALSCEEHLNVLGSGIENWGEVRRCHLCDLTCGESQIRGWLLIEVERVDLELRKEIFRDVGNLNFCGNPNLIVASVARLKIPKAELGQM